MATIRKFMFETDFESPGSAAPGPLLGDTLAAVLDEPPPPPPPTFTEDELAAARDNAYEQGREAGLHEAEAASARLEANALAAIAARVQGLDRRQDEANDLIQREAVRVALALVRKLLPEYGARNALNEIEAMVAECLSHLFEEPRVTVRLSEPLIEPLRARLEQVAAKIGFEGKLLLSADARLAPGDCRVEWAEGGAERHLARLCADIDAVVERAVSAPFAPAHAVAPHVTHEPDSSAAMIAAAQG